MSDLEKLLKGLLIAIVVLTIFAYLGFTLSRLLYDNLTLLKPKYE